MQSGILLFNDVLGGLKASRDQLVSKDDVKFAQMSIRMEKNIKLEYPSEVGFVNEIEIGGCEILVCKNPKNKGIVREKVC